MGEKVRIFENEIRYLKGKHHCKYCGSEVLEERHLSDHYHEDIEYYCTCETVNRIKFLDEEISKLLKELRPLEQEKVLLKESLHQSFKDKDNREVLNEFLRTSGLDKGTVERLLNAEI